MNKDFLSQEEIDALLHKGESKDLIEDDYLSLFDRDALGEIGNISFGTAATTLSTLLRQKVNITTPQVTLMRREDAAADFPIPHVAARVEYTEGLEGANILAIRMDDAQIIADLMLGGDGHKPAAELNDLHLSAVAEAMNQMMGSASTSMSSMLGRPTNISPPKVQIVDMSNVATIDFVPASDILVKIAFHLQVGELIDSHIMQLLSIDFATNLVAMLMEHASGGGTSSEKEVAAAAAPTPAPAQVTQHVMTPEREPVREPVMATMSAGSSEVSRQRAGETAAFSTDMHMPVERAMFSAFEDEPVRPGGKNLELLLDIPLGVTVELGRTRKRIRDILDLAPGSILELDTLAGEPVDILVNNKLIARGEVVVIEENFGVRVTDIISPAERIRRLQ